MKKNTHSDHDLNSVKTPDIIPGEPVRLKKDHSMADLLEILHKIDERRLEAERENARLQYERSERRKSEDQFSTIFDNANFAISLSRIPGGKIVKVNQPFLDLFGFTKEEVIGNTSIELHITDENSRQAVEIEMTRKGFVRDFDCTRYKKDGSLCYLLISLNKINDNSEEFILTTIQDITERRILEDAKITSDQRQHFHLENSPLAMIEWNSDFIVTQWSSAAERIFGWTNEECMNRSIDQLNMIHPEDIPIVEKTIKRLTSGTELQVVTSNRNLTKAGEIIECTWYNSVLLDKNGQMSSVMSFIEDITQRKKMEIALKESEKRYHDLVKYAPTGIFEVDIKTQKLLTINDAMIQMTGYSREEFFTMNPLDIMEEDSMIKFQTWISSIEKGEALDENVEYRLKTKGGHIISTLVNSKYIDNEGGTPSRVLVVARDITARKLAEESVRESERKLSAIMNATNESIWMFSPEGIILHGNPIAYARLGKKEEELVGKHINDVIDPELARSRLGYMQETVKKRDALEFEDERAGRYYRHNFYPVIDDHGQVTSVVAFSRDITKQKVVEEALRLNEARLKLAQKASSAGVWDWDMTKNKITWTEELYELFGLDPLQQEATFENWQEIIYPPDSEVANQRIQVAIEDHTPLFSEYRIILPDGRLKWISALGNTTYDAEDRPVRMSGICFDTTSKHLAEAALLESEQRFRSVLDNSQDIIYRINVQTGHYDYITPSVEKVTGFAQDEIKGFDPETAMSLIHPDSLANYLEAMENLEKTGFAVAEYRFRKKDGSYCWFSNQISLTRDADGRPLYRDGSIRDITARKNIEEEREKLLAEAARRTAELEAILLSQANGLVVYDVNGKIVSLNATAEKFFPREIILERTIEERLELFQWQREDGSHVRAEEMPVIAALQGDTTQDMVISLKSPEGKVWFAVSAAPIRMADGRMLGAVASFVDITKRKQAEEKLTHLNEALEERVEERTAELIKSNLTLQALEAKYRTVADYTYNWEYWINPEGIYNYVSPSCQRITGYSALEFMVDNQLIHKILHPDDWVSFNEKTTAHFKKIHPLYIEFRIISKSGEIKWIGHSRNNIYNQGEYLGVRVSNSDITEKIKAEHELLHIAVEVEERERNRFSRELHDGLGPLLSTVKLYFQWLADTDDPEKIKLITERGNYNIDLAIQTSRELARDMSSMDLEKFGYIESILKFIHGINETNKINISFSSNLPPDKKFNYHIEIVLHRITTELICNTLKHANATKAEIVMNLVKPKNNIEFTYRDNGQGFDPENTETKDKGLGINNIHHRVRTLMGLLKIKSRPGEGMEVRIEIPMSDITKI